MEKPRAEWVTTGPAAKVIRVHPSTLWRWYRDGLVTPAWVTRGGQTRWDVHDLQRQVDQHPELHRGAPPDEADEEDELPAPPPIPLPRAPVAPAFIAPVAGTG